MSTTLVQFDSTTEIVILENAEALAEEYRESFMQLAIAGPEDTKGRKAVHDARMTVSKTRIAIEKRRKEHKADALEFGRRVDEVARLLTAKFTPIEEHLQAIEKTDSDERDRIRKAAEEAKQAATQAIVDSFAKVGYQISFALAGALDAEGYAAMLADKTKLYEAEQERLRKEAEAKAEAERAEADRRKAEDARLAEERKKLDEQRRELEAAQTKQREEQEKIEADKRRLAAEEAERTRRAELEKAKAEAAERAKRETEERIQREKEEAERKAAAAAEKARKREAKRPDREKIVAYADALDAVVAPELTDANRDLESAAIALLQKATREIRELAVEKD